MLRNTKSCGNLVSSAVVDIYESEFSIGVRYRSGDKEPSPTTFPPTTAIRIRLSKKGRVLVDSWKKGDGRLLLDSYNAVPSSTLNDGPNI